MANEWQPIESAPRDAHILLYGPMEPHDQLGSRGPMIFSGYWDVIDSAWCSTGSTWTGPFYTPTHWMPLPAEPGAK